VEAGLKVPHDALPQVTDQVTPPFLLSLFTWATRLAVAEVLMDDGAAELRATEIVGGGVGGVELWPPQAVSQRVNDAIARRETL
jgi:hypothetical protein